MGVSDLKNKGREAFKRKRYELACDAYLEYLQFEPNDEEAMEGFFQAAIKDRETKGKSLFGGMLSKVSMGATKDPKKRMVSCLRALKKNPTNKGLLMSLGEAALSADAIGSAVVAYRHAADADPEDGAPWKHLGEALGRRGRIKEALEALSHAVKINPRDQESAKLRKNLAAEGALKLSGYETAESSRDLIKDKKVAEELETETRMQLTPEHAATEIQKLEAEIQQDPSNGRLHARLADLYLHSGDDAKALGALEAALKTDPDNYDLSVRVGDHRLRKLTAAFKQARETAAADPENASLKQTMEEAQQALTDASLEEHGRRVREHPLDLATRFTYGRWLLQAGRDDEALAEFQQTVRDPNRKVESLRFQAKCFEKKKLIGLAVKKLEEAIAEYPSLASPKAKEIYYEYADMRARKGDKEEARKIFEQIVEADASYKDALKRLEQLTADEPAAN